jgi:hypothetical protein
LLIAAARLLDTPSSRRPSYCFGFLIEGPGLLPGMIDLLLATNFIAIV